MQTHEQVNPKVVEAAKDASASLDRIVFAYSHLSSFISPLKRQADARELRLIAKAITDLAKAL